MEVTRTIAAHSNMYGARRFSAVLLVVTSNYLPPLGGRYLVHKHGIIDIDERVVVEFEACMGAMDVKLSFDDRSICLVTSETKLRIVTPSTAKIETINFDTYYRRIHINDAPAALRRFPIQYALGHYTRYGRAYTEYWVVDNQVSTYDTLKIPWRCVYSPDGYNMRVGKQHYTSFNGNTMASVPSQRYVQYGETSYVQARIGMTRHYAA